MLFRRGVSRFLLPSAASIVPGQDATLRGPGVQERAIMLSPSECRNPGFDVNLADAASSSRPASATAQTGPSSTAATAPASL